MMISSDGRIIEGLRSTSLFTIGSIQGTMDSIESYFYLHKFNRQLRTENTRLAYENFQLQDALLENIRLRKQLQYKYEVKYDLIPAKVIGFSPHDFVTGLLLSTKDIQKVREDAAVMTAEGLVGKIVKMSSKYAICQNLLDPNSRVSVRVQRNRELGLISWDGGSSLLLGHIPNTISILKGDVLFTSGYSQIYPPNIKVGIVTGIQINEDQLFQTITVKPSVNFNRLEEVFILQAKQINESGN
jgi:rod shape-determining protein MreC